MSKHYIRIDNDNNIIAAFSSDFEQPRQDDICVNEEGSRHFNLNLSDTGGEYRLKYEGEEIIEKTEEELYPLSKRKINKKIEIKQKAFSTIVNKLPEWKQRNLIARFLELVDKETITQEETTEKEGIMNQWSWVKDIRTQSDDMESVIDAFTTFQELFDYNITFVE